MEEVTMEQPIEQTQEETKIVTDTDIAAAKKQAAKERMAKARMSRKPRPVVRPKADPVPQAPIIKVDKSSDEPIVFFTEADVDPITKKVRNTYPTYFNRKQKDDLEEEIRKMEKGLANNYYQPDDIGKVREQLKKAKDSMEKIQEHAPLFEKQKDRIYEMTKELGDRIAPSMFTRSEMMKGTADAHEEARRMSEPVIELTPEMAGLAEANGMRLGPGRRVSRNDATRLWQFGRKALGEMTNSEVLRRD